MPFGLKNVEATYQRMITRMFKQQADKIVKVYIDDMMVKHKKEEEHVLALAKVFKILRCHKLHLNVTKCAFGVGSGNFLGYMIIC